MVVEPFLAEASLVHLASFVVAGVLVLPLKHEVLVV